MPESGRSPSVGSYSPPAGPSARPPSSSPSPSTSSTTPRATVSSSKSAIAKSSSTPAPILNRLGAESRALLVAANFSLRNTVNLTFQWLEAGTWIRMIQARDFDLEARGALRTTSGIQSLLSLSLVAFFLLPYFRNPFD